jgi:small subunit ribosomal protein S9
MAEDKAQNAPEEPPKAEAPAAAEEVAAPEAADAAPEAEAPKAEPQAQAPAAEDEEQAEETEGPQEAAKAEEPEPEPEVPAPPLPEGRHYIWGTGRRKKAVARVRIRPGTGKFLVNKREADAYFNHQRDRDAIVAPLRAAKMVRGWDVWANVNGGGHTGQAGAVVLGLARALAKAMPETESTLRDHGLLTRDARMSERKKPGQPGARKRFQFSKR